MFDNGQPVACRGSGTHSDLFPNAATTEKACGLPLFIAQGFHRIEAARTNGL